MLIVGYVPIEEHVKREWLENFLREKFSSFIRIDETGDPNIDSMTNSDYSKEIWGGW